ncbi:hypothetical protein ACS0TY_022090 [Phlomoides rotata]
MDIAFLQSCMCSNWILQIDDNNYSIKVSEEYESSLDDETWEENDESMDDDSSLWSNDEEGVNNVHKPAKASIHGKSEEILMDQKSVQQEMRNHNDTVSEDGENTKDSNSRDVKEQNNALIEKNNNDARYKP